MQPSPRNWVEVFWAEPPALPPGVRLERESVQVVPRPGPGGSAVLQWALLSTPGARARLLLTWRPRLLARHVLALKPLLADVIDARRRSDFATDRLAALPVLPVVVTEHAAPKIVDTCLREGVGLIALDGVVVVQGAGLHLHWTERRRRRPVVEAQLRFTGQTGQVVRTLLTEPGEVRTARRLADLLGASYAPVYEALRRLEEANFVQRRSPRSGFRLHDAPGLLRAWIDARTNGSALVESFFAPDTRPAALARLEGARVTQGRRAAFTLASGLRPEEVHVAGLPHGLYVTGDSDWVVETLGLRRVTPHNFLLLRPEPAADTETGGVYTALRSLEHGPGVCLPQLAADLATVPGRGREQALFLLQKYADAVGGGS